MLKVWKYSLFFLLCTCTCSVYAHYVQNFFLDFIDSSRTGTEMAQWSTWSERGKYHHPSFFLWFPFTRGTCMYSTIHVNWVFHCTNHSRFIVYLLGWFSSKLNCIKKVENVYPHCIGLYMIMICRQKERSLPCYALWRRSQWTLIVRGLSKI